jgi:hypothetical protein
VPKAGPTSGPGFGGWRVLLTNGPGNIETSVDNTSPGRPPQPGKTIAVVPKWKAGSPGAPRLWRAPPRVGKPGGKTPAPLPNFWRSGNLVAKSRFRMPPRNGELAKSEEPWGAWQMKQMSQNHRRRNLGPPVIAEKNTPARHSSCGRAIRRAREGGTKIPRGARKWTHSRWNSKGESASLYL